MTALLKQATRELVLACGRKRAGAVLNVSAGMIAKWEGDAYPNQIPLWAVALLEFELQAPVFTRTLASVSGYGLTPLADSDDDGCGDPGMADVAALASVGAKAVAAAAEAEADGRWTPGEAKAVMERLGAVQAQAGVFKRKLSVVVGGAG
jgi:hypothetical protein